MPNKSRKNEGIGSMEAFLQMRKSQQDAEDTNQEELEVTVHLPHAQSHDKTIEIPSGTPQIKKRRGPTKMNDVYTRREKKVIKLNSEFQAVTDDKKVLSEFNNFLGTLARQVVPLNCISWHKYPEEEKDELWSFVKSKYIIPDEGKTFTLRTINALWRLHKSRVKKAYYLRYDADEERLRNKPSVVSAEAFKVLCKYWGDDEIKRRSKAASENRSLIVETHTAGRTSFAQIGEKIKIDEKLDAEEPVPLDIIYVKTRKRTAGRTYKTPFPTDDDGEEVPADDGSETVKKVKKPAHGPNWLLGRSGRSRKTKKNVPLSNDQSSSCSTDVADLKRTVREELVAEMQEMVDKKVHEKLTKVIGRLGKIVPEFKDVVIEELLDVDGDAGEDDQ